MIRVYEKDDGYDTRPAYLRLIRSIDPRYFELLRQKLRLTNDK